jgi:apolipoprotein N-acyltransferase
MPTSAAAILLQLRSIVQHVNRGAIKSLRRRMKASPHCPPRFKGAAMIARFLAAFALGAFAACGFAPFDLWPLTLACLAILLAMLSQADTLRRALAIGWFFGFGHFCVGLNWIATAFTFQAAMPAWLGWIAVVLLSLYLAVYPALATGAAWLLAGRKPTALGPCFAATWIVAEFLRATLFSGFAWNPLGVVWLPTSLPVARASILIGTYGLSGLVILTSASAWLFFRRNFRAGGVAILPVAIAFAAGLPFETPRSAEPRPLLHIVQPNINQAEKWDEAAEATNFARIVRLTGKPGSTPRLILWPEVAIPWFLEEDANARRALANLLGPHDLLLTGGEAFQYDRAGNPVTATNSVFGMTPQGRLLGRYDKAHLVPYGEYLPMRPLLSRIGLSRLAPGDMDFLSGPGPRNVILPGFGPVGVQICYEIIFSGHVVDRANRPLFLFNPSNDAWFGRWGPPQHLAQARLRAIEEGLPVVRATPTGISAIIQPDGQITASVPWGRAGAIEGPLPPAMQPTPFARLGNVLPLGFSGLLMLAGLATRRRNAKRS